MRGVRLVGGEGNFSESKEGGGGNGKKKGKGGEREV